MHRPRAVLPEFDRLKIASMLKDVEIENRIRPKRRKVGVKNTILPEVP
jgi:hypothetical protein